MKPVIILTQVGCFLPILIFFNLFFGWMFFNPSTWLVIELVLVLLFILNAILVSKKVFSSLTKESPRKESPRTGAIDIEARVMEDNEHLPEHPA